MKINYLETRAAKVCLPFTAPYTQNRKDVNRISFLNRGYAFNCLVAVLNSTLVFEALHKAKELRPEQHFSSPPKLYVPGSCLSESNPPLLRNKEDQMSSSISQGFALCNSRQNYEEPLYVLGLNKILVKLLSEYVSQPL